MTKIDGLSLNQAELAIEGAHPGWHVWHSQEDDGQPAREYATTTTCDMDGSGTTLSAPSVERIEEVIGKWEWAHEQAAGAAA